MVLGRGQGREAARSLYHAPNTREVHTLVRTAGGASLTPEHQEIVTTTAAYGPEAHFTPSNIGRGGYGLAAFGSF
jgi:hypothetical protein